MPNRAQTSRLPPFPMPTNSGPGSAPMLTAYLQKRTYAHKQHRKPRHAHGRKRVYAAEVAYVERRCDCRCGRVFQKPRTRRQVDWGTYAPPRVYKERRHRVRMVKHGRASLTYRHGRHYIH